MWLDFSETDLPYNETMKKRRNIPVWYGRIEDAPKYEAVRYWQTRTDEERFRETWQMILDAHAMKGEDLSESRLQRTVGGLRPIPG